MKNPKPNGIWLCRDGSIEEWKDGACVQVITGAVEPFMEEAIASAKLEEDYEEIG